MTGVAKVRACIGSTNSVKQGFPYGQGNTTARLCIYKDSDGVESSLTINQGQLMCDLDSATFLLKIDDDEPNDMSCVGTSSHDSEMGYFSQGDSAVNSIIAAKKIIRIETTLYNYGNAVFRFPSLGKTLPKEFEAQN